MKKHLFSVLLLLLSTISPDAFAGTVRFTTSDGQRLLGSYEAAPGGSTRGALLVHGEGGARGDWRYFTPNLNRAGFNTLAIDLRVDGAEEGAEITDEQWGAARLDLEGAIRWMRGEGLEEIIIIGSSIGANLAMVVAADDPNIAKLVLFSPGLTYKGIAAEAAIEPYGARPLFIAVSRQDSYASRSSLYFDAQALGPHHLEVLQRAGHGSTMLDTTPSLTNTVIQWIQESGSIEDRRVEFEHEITTGDTTEKESTGEYLPTGPIDPR